ncbi:hypothetical protein HQ520_02910 [bacterium]|nr:hypothetical protein [bacterium]
MYRLLFLAPVLLLLGCVRPFPVSPPLYQGEWEGVGNRDLFWPDHMDLMTTGAEWQLPSIGTAPARLATFTDASRGRDGRVSYVRVRDVPDLTDARVETVLRFSESGSGKGPGIMLRLQPMDDVAQMRYYLARIYADVEGPGTWDELHLYAFTPAPMKLAACLIPGKGLRAGEAYRFRAWVQGETVGASISSEDDPARDLAACSVRDTSLPEGGGVGLRTYLHSGLEAGDGSSVIFENLEVFNSSDDENSNSGS